MDTVRFAALAAALALALPAEATQKMTALAARAPEARPRPAAGDGGSPLASATEAPSRDWRVGPALGFEFGMGDLKYGGPKIRIDAERTVQRRSPFTTVSFVGSLSVTHASGSESVPIVVAVFPFPVVRNASLEWDANVFELVPAARVTYAATPKLSLFADGGLGLVYTAANVHLPPVAAGVRTEDVVAGGVGAVLRLAAGLVFNPTPALRIGVEAIGLNIRFGDGVGSGLSVVASLSHRL